MQLFLADKEVPRHPEESNHLEPAPAGESRPNDLLGTWIVGPVTPQSPADEHHASRGLFHHSYGHPLIPKEVARVMSLRDGKKKMSKSEDSDYSRINSVSYTHLTLPTILLV